jgi:hypothetical protein
LVKGQARKQETDEWRGDSGPFGFADGGKKVAMRYSFEICFREEEGHPGQIGACEFRIGAQGVKRCIGCALLGDPRRVALATKGKNGKAAKGLHHQRRAATGVA